MLSLCILATSLGAYAQAPSKTLRTYIVAGQSNAEGIGIGRNAAAYNVNPKQDLNSFGYGHYLTNTDRALVYKGHPDSGVGPGWSNLQASFGVQYELYQHNNNFFGPELAIGRELSHHLGEQIALIKYSKGATSLAVDWDPTNPGNNCYDYLINTIVNSTQAANVGNVALDIQGVFWMQGESDSLDLNYAQNYKANLLRFISTLRTKLGKPDLDIYVATIKDASVWTYRQLIWDAQQAVADADPHVYLIDAKTLETYASDPMHYTARGEVVLGQRFALQALYDIANLGQVAW
ncbi:sialate O-acetylesterase [Lysobacter sp. cf310]|uniref:sialate O-acetylesterase n=1 Tax=Lysobacter sp. cf310 TaxID=1761790 RepID=UPI0008EC3ADC|nr:sialate O-acetylesterase [Lysobacter sp. cf310]SFK69077.1 protein of unknown function [Lysobacter sp. cf310]